MPVYSEIVLITALAVECGRAAGSIGRSAWDAAKKTREVPAVKRDVRICCAVITPDRSADNVSRMTAAGAAVTDSFCDPTSRTMARRACHSQIV